jgi:hypothetical protein
MLVEPYTKAQHFSFVGDDWPLPSSKHSELREHTPPASTSTRGEAGTGGEHIFVGPLGFPSFVQTPTDARQWANRSN